MIVYANTDYYRLRTLHQKQQETMGKTHEIPTNTEGGTDNIQSPSFEEVPPEVRESIPQMVSR